MKKWWLIILLLTPLGIRAQIITTVAGGGTGGDGSQAAAASIYDPNGLAFDKYGNLFFATNLGNQVRKIDTVGIITTIAGTGTAGFSGDSGLAINATLDQPTAIAFDTLGNLYIADAANNRIRKIVTSTGIITTIAGNLSPCCTTVGSYNGDGEIATLATLNLPTDICFDKNDNLYIADNANNRVRKISSSGIITTFAGDGLTGYTDSSYASTAHCGPPNSLCFDNVGNLYIGGYGLIMRVDTMGFISIIAGEDTTAGSYWAYNGDEIPATSARLDPGMLAVDPSGSLYIADELNYRIRMIDALGIIHTVACNGIDGYSGDGGNAVWAETTSPYGITFDSCGNLYFTQVNIPRIRKISFNPSCLPEKVDNLIQQNISIHPNPATNEINIDNIQATTNYQLLNIVGAIMQQGVLKEGNNSISVQALPPGMYLLALTDGEGKRVVNKIVKE